MVGPRGGGGGAGEGEGEGEGEGGGRVRVPRGAVVEGDFEEEELHEDHDEGLDEEGGFVV